MVSRGVNHRIYYARQWNSTAAWYIDMLRTVWCACICARNRCAEAKHFAEHSPWHCCKNKRIINAAHPPHLRRGPYFIYDTTELKVTLLFLSHGFFKLADDLRQYTRQKLTDIFRIIPQNKTTILTVFRSGSGRKFRSWNLRTLRCSRGRLCYFSSSPLVWEKRKVLPAFVRDLTIL